VTFGLVHLFRLISEKRTVTDDIDGPSTRRAIGSRDPQRGGVTGHVLGTAQPTPDDNDYNDLEAVVLFTFEKFYPKDERAERLTDVVRGEAILVLDASVTCLTSLKATRKGIGACC